MLTFIGPIIIGLGVIIAAIAFLMKSKKAETTDSEELEELEEG